MVAAIGNATKKGILIKSGAAVEALAKIDTLVFDKTGTLTYGKLHVEEILIVDSSLKRSNFIAMIASAEKFSEHPLGKAIVAYGHKIFIGEKIIDSETIDNSAEIISLIHKMQNVRLLNLKK